DNRPAVVTDLIGGERYEAGPHVRRDDVGEVVVGAPRRAARDHHRPEVDLSADRGGQVDLETLVAPFDLVDGVKRGVPGSAAHRDHRGERDLRFAAVDLEMV